MLHILTAEALGKKNPIFRMLLSTFVTWELSKIVFLNVDLHSFNRISFITENEDCLFLNVFVPSTIKPDDKMAVMVWIHGGGFVTGSSTEYPGHVLAAFNDVIVVTFNYRLGILGFLSIPETDFKGNYGMFDQVNEFHRKDNVPLFLYKML